MKLTKKLSLSGIALGLGAAVTLSVLTAGTASANAGDDVYQGCSSWTRNHEVTTDDNGIQVYCDEWPKGGNLIWNPVLTPGTIPTKSYLSACPVSGLRAKTSGNTDLICGRSFDDYYYLYM